MIVVLSVYAKAKIDLAQFFFSTMGNEEEITKEYSRYRNFVALELLLFASKITGIILWTTMCYLSASEKLIGLLDPHQEDFLQSLIHSDLGTRQWMMIFVSAACASVSFLLARQDPHEEIATHIFRIRLPIRITEIAVFLTLKFGFTLNDVHNADFYDWYLAWKNKTDSKKKIGIFLALYVISWSFDWAVLSTSFIYAS
jgi:hypothetical protein